MRARSEEAPRRSPLLTQIGAQIRELRRTRGVTQRALAEQAELSPRFLAQVEAGEGNISVKRLAAIASALGVRPAELLEPRTPAPERPIIALLGVRGAGKSTIGQRLAERLGVPFVELDSAIEQAAGIPLAQIFELHGERYYRRVEREVLQQLLSQPDGRGLVIATGGSLVNERTTFNLLRRNAATVWLKARPEDHWNRVVEQGDVRPMAKNPHAMAELKALLSARAPLYQEASHTVDTSKLDVEEAVGTLLQIFRSGRSAA